MTRTKKADKAIDNQIEQAWYKHASGVQIDIMDISKVFADCRTGLMAGGELDALILAAVARYRKN